MLGNLFLAAKFHSEQLIHERRQKEFKLKAVFGQGVIMSSESTLDNDSGKPEKIAIGKASWVRGCLLVYNAEGQIIIGENTFIGLNTRIWSAKKITIGNNVLISHDVNIHDNNSHPLNSSKRKEHYQKIILGNSLPDNYDLRAEEIIIEDDVWIGFNVSIQKGVVIGKGAIVGANMIVTKNVPPYAIIVSDTKTRIINYSD